MKTITICCSLNFAREVFEVKDELEARGYRVLVPATAEKMHEAGDYDVNRFKPQPVDASDYHRKGIAMRKHFPKLEQADAVLVLNYEKNGQANYIGGNTLIELAIAFYLNKPIYLLNEIPHDSSYAEELCGFEPIELHGKLEELQI